MKSNLYLLSLSLLLVIATTFTCDAKRVFKFSTSIIIKAGQNNVKDHLPWLQWVSEQTCLHKALHLSYCSRLEAVSSFSESASPPLRVDMEKSTPLECKIFQNASA